MSEHGFSRYGYGCRCEVCRAGKAAYMRKRRAAGRQARLAAETEGRRYVAEGITHGLTGYKEFSCRCLTCRLSNAAQRAKCRNSQAEKGAA